MIDRNTPPAHRDRRRPRRRARLLALAVLALSVAPGAGGLAGAAPAEASGVQVTINGQNGPRLSLEDLRQSTDVAPVPTTSKSASGSDVQPRGGVSAAELVRLSGVAARSFTVMRVGAARLRPSEVNGGFTGDPSGEIRYATFDPSGSSVSFFRPMRDANDLNADDRVEPGPGGVLTVELDTNGDPLSVSIDVDRTQVDAGQTVTFTARVSGQSGGEALTYFWEFGDRTEADTPTVSHVYRADGSYETRLTVVGSNGSSGVAAPVRVQVGNQQPGGRSTTPATRTPSSRGGGGRAAGGGTASTGGGRGDGAASGPVRGPGRGPGGGGGGGGGGAGGGAPRPGGAGLSSPDSGGERGEGARTRGEEQTAAARGGRPVDGILLEGSSALAGSLLSAAEEERRAQQRVRAAAGSPPGPLVWLASGALCVMLLLAGAAREIYRIEPHPQPT